MGDRQFVTHQGSEQARIGKLNGPAKWSSYAAKAGGLNYLGKQLSIRSLGGLLGHANSESSEVLFRYGQLYESPAAETGAGDETAKQDARTLDYTVCCRLGDSLVRP